MDLTKLLSLFAALMLTLNVSCKKKEEEEEEDQVTIQPQILRLPIPDDTGLRGLAGFTDPLDDTSLMQSFTPSSIKLSISDIKISGGDADDWDAPGSMIYNCEYDTNEECMVEVSDLQEFEDALNAEPKSIAPGEYTKITVGMCKEESDGVQHIEVTGSSTLNGVVYRTDTDEGIVAGPAADATPVLFKFGGCAVNILLATPINAELTEEQQAAAEEEDCTDCAPTVEADIGIRLIFDSYNFAALGNMLNDATKQLVANAADQIDSYPFNDDEDAPCKGDKEGLFICTQRTALFATDDQAPTIERYNIVLTDTDSINRTATPEATAYTGIMLRSDDEIIAAYTRRSVNEGAAFNRSQKGDEQYFGIEKNDDDSYAFGEGYTVSNPSYAEFKREDHTGTRLALDGETQIPYSAVKIEE
jgi:hypothetical protein